MTHKPKKEISISKELLEEILEELEGASDFYGEGPYPVDEKLLFNIKKLLIVKAEDIL